MPRSETKNIRNIALAGHAGSGKTTLVETILHKLGLIDRAGTIEEGNTICDFEPEEKEHLHSLSSSLVNFDHEGKHFNIIDTPGHVDFTIEVERSMRVLDGAVAVFDGKEGVEAQSETVWRQAERYSVPRVCFINKMDKIGADWEFSFNSIRERLGANPIAVQYPIGSGHELEGIVDLINMKAYYYDAGELGAKVEEKEIPENIRERCEKLRAEMIEAACSFSDDMMEKVIEDKPVSNDEIKAAIRKGVLEMKCNAIFTGSALKNIGVQRLIDGVIDYLPSPVEVGDIQGTDPRDESNKLTRPNSTDASFSALVFKVVADTHGDLTYMRVYSGAIKKGERVLNPGNGKREIISRMFEMHAKDRQALDETFAGSIVAIVGLKDSYTGDTLCAIDDPIVLERMTFPEPVISMSIEPLTAEDKRKLGDALVTIRREDPSFQSNYNDETGQTIISGMGELHLEIIKNKLVRDMKVGVEVGTPRVSYREAITGSAKDVRGKFVKQTGGRGQFGDVTIDIEPFTAAQAEEEGLNFKGGVAFKNEIVGGKIPREYIPSVEAGVRRTAASGIMAGYPLIGFKVSLVDGSYHPVDSSQVAFEQAARLALSEACNKAGLTLLEPIMKVVITTPDDYIGSVTGDVSSRRGLVIGTEERGNARLITAEVPLSEMFGYTTVLRSMSQGRATSSMEPLEYRPLPPSMVKEVVAAV